MVRIAGAVAGGESPDSSELRGSTDGAAAGLLHPDVLCFLSQERISGQMLSWFPTCGDVVGETPAFASVGPSPEV